MERLIGYLKCREKYKLFGGANYELEGQKQIKQMQGHLKNKEETNPLITKFVY